MTLNQILNKAHQTGVPSFNMDVYYQTLYAYVSTTFGGDDLPEFLVVYSKNREASIRKFRGRSYVVYDRYLGKTFNFLNRLFLSGATEVDIEPWLYRLYAEEFQLCGMLRHAHLCATRYAVADPADSIFRGESQQDLFIRHSLTLLQELFVIFHEFLHLLSKTREKLKVQFHDPGSAGTHRARLERVIRITYEEDQSLNDLLQYLSNNEKIIDECLCDDYAYKFLSNVKLPDLNPIWPRKELAALAAFTVQLYTELFWGVRFTVYSIRVLQSVLGGEITLEDSKSRLEMLTLQRNSHRIRNANQGGAICTVVGGVFSTNLESWDSRFRVFKEQVSAIGTRLRMELMPHQFSFEASERREMNSTVNKLLGWVAAEV